jgi:hypothetical protein
MVGTYHRGRVTVERNPSRAPRSQSTVDHASRLNDGCQQPSEVVSPSLTVNENHHSADKLPVNRNAAGELIDGYQQPCPDMKGRDIPCWLTRGLTVPSIELPFDLQTAMIRESRHTSLSGLAVDGPQCHWQLPSEALEATGAIIGRQGRGSCGRAFVREQPAVTVATSRLYPVYTNLCYRLYNIATFICPKKGKGLLVLPLEYLLYDKSVHRLLSRLQGLDLLLSTTILRCCGDQQSERWRWAHRPFVLYPSHTNECHRLEMSTRDDKVSTGLHFGHDTQTFSIFPYHSI